MHNLTQNLLIKLTLVCVLMIHLSKSLQAQKNLVPNPSFEHYINCPNRNLYTGTTNFHIITPSIWYKPDRGGGWYYNACANAADTFFGVPKNLFYSWNYQPAKTGNGYIVLFFRNNNQYNFYQVKLLDSCKKGHKYYAENYVNLTNDSRFGCNNQGLLFTPLPVYVDTDAVPRVYILPAIPQIENKYVITDTLNWVKVAGVFTAQGGEQYLTMGNFRTDALTAFTQIQPFPSYAGARYYVDDVAVYDLDSFNLQADAGRDTTITKGDSAFIGSYTSGLDTLKWQVLVNGQVIDTIRPGFWVKPTTNTCYVLTQTVNGYTSSDTVCVYVNALPVRFVSLSVSPSPPLEGSGVVNREVNIKFSTANEINVSHYNIQYSSNGKDFKTTGNPIPAKGGSFNEYMVSNSPPLEGLGVVDGVINNIVYYRIQATDHDGQQTFSEIKSIKLNTTGLVSIYPNPANNEVTVTGKNIQQISISDVAGKTLISTNNKKINISSLPNGTYFISIKTTHTYEVQKLVKW